MSSINNWRIVNALLAGNSNEAEFFIPKPSLMEAINAFIEKHGEYGSFTDNETFNTLTGDQHILRRIPGEFQGLELLQVQDEFKKDAWQNVYFLRKPLFVSDESQTEIAYLIVRPDCYWQPRVNQATSMGSFLSNESFRDIALPVKVSTGGRGYFMLRVIPGFHQGETIMQIQDRSVLYTWRQFIPVSSAIY